MTSTRFPTATALLAALLVSAVAPPAHAQTVAPGWRHKPTPAQVARYYPAAARAQGIEGEVLLRCKLSEAGQLSYCVAVQVSPLSQGFAVAAVRVSRLMSMTPRRVNGQPVASTVDIPVSFNNFRD